MVSYPRKNREIARVSAAVPRLRIRLEFCVSRCAAPDLFKDDYTDKVLLKIKHQAPYGVVSLPCCCRALCVAVRVASSLPFVRCASNFDLHSMHAKQRKNALFRLLFAD